MCFVTSNIYAANNEVFICMKSDSTMAYQSINYGALEYLEMKDSNGVVAKARIIDGRTYLPFRYIAEIAGLTEAVDSQMDVNTFKYSSAGNGSITINTKNGRIIKNVDVEFEYKDSDGEMYLYKIVNINGSLYFPMRYMASLIGAEVDYENDTGNIYFMSNYNVRKAFLNNDKSIKYEKLAAINNYTFDNTLGYSDIYLMSDGKTVSSVTEEIHDGNTYYSVARERKNLYFVDENYEMFTKKEGESEYSRIGFYNTKNEKINPKILTIVTYKNKLYGIEIDDVNSSAGKIFQSDLDGENYKYIGTCKNAYNIILREHNDIGYIFYVDIKNQTDIHRINLLTGEDVKLNILGFGGEQPISKIDIMSVNDGKMIVSRYDVNKIEIMNLYGSVYEDSDIKAELVGVIDHLNAVNSVMDILSLNYDTDNELLYFINSNGKNYGIYCYDVLSGYLQAINTSSTLKARISIIKIDENIYRIYHYSDYKNNKYNYELVSIIPDENKIKIGNSIEFDR